MSHNTQTYELHQLQGKAAGFKEILRCEVGSSLYGTSIEDQSDHDEMGICIETPEFVTGLNRFEQYQYRTQPEGIRSGPGDLDLTVYGLQKYLKLAMNGNPSILQMMYVPPERQLISTYWGKLLQNLAPHIASKVAGRCFLGYMEAQKMRLLGVRGGTHGRRGGGQRQELIDQYGFDVKFSYHMVRLGFQGREYLATGRLTLPMVGEELQICRDIRVGKYTQAEVVKMEEDLETDLKRLMDKDSPLPDKPDYESINKWMHYFYMNIWNVE